MRSGALRGVSRGVGAARAASLLADVRRVARRAHDLQVRSWVSLALFGVLVLLSVDVLGAGGGRPVRVRCAGVPGGWVCQLPRGASGVVHSVEAQGTTVIALSARAPVVQGLGQDWWYWSVAVPAGTLILVVLRRRRDLSSPCLLRWHLIAAGGALAIQIVCRAVGWSPAAAGVFAVAFVLGTMATADRAPAVLGTAGVLMASVVVARCASSIPPLRSVLPVGSALRLAVGLTMVGAAGLLRWCHLRGGPRRFEQRPSPLQQSMGECADHAR
jgi:hypothetical protein